MRQLKKISAILIALAIFMTGCAGGDTSWVYESAELKMPPGTYILLQIDALSVAEQELSASIREAGGTYESTTVAKLLQQSIGDKTVEQTVLENTAAKAHEFFAVEQKFAEYGMSLDEMRLADAAGRATSAFAGDADYYRDNGIAESSIRVYIENSMKRDVMFYDLYTEGGAFGVPDSELRAKFQSEFARADYLMFPKHTEVPEGETAVVEELNATLKTTAEGYLEKLAAGESVEQLAFDRAGEMLTDEQKATLALPEVGSQTLLVSEDSKLYYGEAINDGIMNAKDGESKLIEDENNFYAIRKLDLFADITVYEQMVDTLLYNLKYEEYLEQIKQWGSEMTLNANDAALALYKPAKIKFRKVAA